MAKKSNETTSPSATQAAGNSQSSPQVRDFASVEATFRLKVLKPGEIVAKLRREIR